MTGLMRIRCVFAVGAGRQTARRCGQPERGTDTETWQSTMKSGTEEHRDGGGGPDFHHVAIEQRTWSMKSAAWRTVPSDEGGRTQSQLTGTSSQARPRDTSAVCCVLDE